MGAVIFNISASSLHSVAMIVSLERFFSKALCSEYSTDMAPSFCPKSLQDK